MDSIDLPSVINYRSVHKSNKVYRSARWDEAETRDVEKLKTLFPVVLDLRSKAEIFFQPPPVKRTVSKIFSKGKIPEPSSNRSSTSDDIHANGDKSFSAMIADQLMSPRRTNELIKETKTYVNPDGSKQKIVYINFTDFHYQKNVIWKRTKIRDKFAIFWSAVTFTPCTN